MGNETERRRGRKGIKNLDLAERGRIAALWEQGYNYSQIGRMLGRSETTISNEIKRGTVEVMDTNLKKKKIYSPEAGQFVSDRTRRKGYTKRNTSEKYRDFLEWIEHMVIEEKYSIDAAVGYAKEHELFPREEMLCTTTIYNYVEKRKTRIRPIDLPNKVRRRVKTSNRPVAKKNRRKFGRSIEERTEVINERKEFGHWEIDLVIGKKSKDCALLTLTERVTRKEYLAKISAKTAEAVESGLKEIFRRIGKGVKDVIRSITADNGSEFAKLHELEKEKGIKVFYAHPYSSWERGTNEHCNGLIRRKIPKGKYISKYTKDRIRKIEEWVNRMPRKILGYKTANEAYEAELLSLGYL